MLLRAFTYMGTTLTGGGIVGAIFGQSSSGTLDWNSILGGALGSSPIVAVLFWQLNKAQGDAKEAREETRQVRDKASTEMRDMQRAHVELIERMFPVLTDATRAIADVQRGMEAVMTTPRQPAAERVMSRRLEEVLSALESGIQEARDVRNDARGER